MFLSLNSVALELTRCPEGYSVHEDRFPVNDKTVARLRQPDVTPESHREFFGPFLCANNRHAQAPIEAFVMGQTHKEFTALLGWEERLHARSWTIQEVQSLVLHSWSQAEDALRSEVERFAEPRPPSEEHSEEHSEDPKYPSWSERQAWRYPPVTAALLFEQPSFSHAERLFRESPRSRPSLKTLANRHQGSLHDLLDSVDDAMFDSALKGPFEGDSVGAIIGFAAKYGHLTWDRLVASDEELAHLPPSRKAPFADFERRAMLPTGESLRVWQYEIRRLRTLRLALKATSLLPFKEGVDRLWKLPRIEFGSPRAKGVAAAAYDLPVPSVVFQQDRYYSNRELGCDGHELTPGEVFTAVNKSALAELSKPLTQSTRLQPQGDGCIEIVPNNLRGALYLSLLKELSEGVDLRVCAAFGCRKPLDGLAPQARFCSPECRRKTQNERAYQRARSKRLEEELKRT